MPIIRLSQENADRIARQQATTTNKLEALLNPQILCIEIIKPEKAECPV